MKSFFIILLMPFMAKAACFDRFYTNQHLADHPPQEVRSINMTWDWSYDYDLGESIFPVKMQFHKVVNGENIIGEAEGHCDKGFDVYDPVSVGTVNCRFDKVGSGSFTLKGQEARDPLLPNDPNKYPALLGKLNSNVTFKNVSPGSSGTTSISQYDSTFRVFNNVQMGDQSCAEPMFKPYVVSVPRLWNEVILQSVRWDLARPTVTARNLFHLSALLWDVYAAYNKGLNSYFVQRDLPELSGEEKQKAIDEALSYAAYTFINARYENAPGNTTDIQPDGEFGDGFEDRLIATMATQIMRKLRYEPYKQPTYGSLDPATVGILMAQEVLEMNKNDGSREEESYSHDPSYPLINKSSFIDIAQSGIKTPKVWEENSNGDWVQVGGDDFASNVNIDYWNPLYVPGSLDQGGNGVEAEQAPLTLFWGEVPTFGDLSRYASEGSPKVYFNNEAFNISKYYPYYLENAEEMIKQNLDVMVASQWLSPVDVSADQVDFDGDGIADQNPGASYIDISPKSLGKNPLGTNDGQGHQTLPNPITGQPYQPYMVKAADFYRSIAEFWADGPSSETPPGHWNTLANYVLDQMEKQNIPFQWKGQGPVMDREKYELMTYLTLNGALHDAAVVAWSIKGYFQGNRPISVVRKLAKMAEEDPAFGYELASKYDFLEMVTFESGKVYLWDDELPEDTETVTKLAVKAWRGAAYFEEDNRNYSFRFRTPEALAERDYYSDKGVGGVGWILLENWLPYQRANFVTPPFPGFVSGHSTFSRAAAEVLAGVTGSEYFPGGLGTYPAPNLHFEETMEEPFEFQWATYFDASDQSGISRIYGGIHASYDDLPARKVGAEVGKEAVQRADQFFNQ